MDFFILNKEIKNTKSTTKEQLHTGHQTNIDIKYINKCFLLRIKVFTVQKSSTALYLQGKSQKLALKYPKIMLALQY